MAGAPHPRRPPTASKGTAGDRKGVSFNSDSCTKIYFQTHKSNRIYGRLRYERRGGDEDRAAKAKCQPPLVRVNPRWGISPCRHGLGTRVTERAIPNCVRVQVPSGPPPLHAGRYGCGYTPTLPWRSASGVHRRMARRARGAGWSSGRMSGFDPEGPGSNPGPATSS